jgi:phospholipase/carboxylesterase
MAALEFIETETGPQPGATVVILHGLGADGNDFVPIAQELDLSAIGPVRFVFPHAPVMPVTINSGTRMRAWYDILGVDLGSSQDETGLRKSMAEIEELLAREKARGMPANRIVLGGFSQGSAIALMTGVRHKERLAGIVGMSGYLPLAPTTAAERSDANALTPIFMGHGQQDTVVDMARAEASCDVLRALGYEVAWHDYPMAHAVCREEIEDLGRWLTMVLAKP